jgi:transposase-like protein
MVLRKEGALGLVRNSLNYVNWKERKLVAADLKQVYHATTVEEADQQLCEFERQWNEKYSSIGRCGGATGPESCPFLPSRPRISLNHFTLLWGDRIETAQARPSR